MRPQLAAGLRDQLLAAAKGTLLLRVGSLLATISTSVVLARALGPTEFGLYSYVFAIITVLALPSQVGIPTLLVRETAKAQANGHWSTLKGLWLWSSSIILVTSLALAVVAGAVLWLRDGIESHFAETVVAGLFLIPLVALGNARGAALRGLRFIVRGQVPENLLRPTFLVAFIGIAWLTGDQLTASHAMGWHVLAALIAFLTGAFLLWKARPPEIGAAIASYASARAWLNAAVPLAMVSGLQMAGNQSGILLLGYFQPEPDVAMYKVAVSASTLALFGLQTVNLVIEPHVARLHSLGDTARLQRLARVGAIASAAFTLPVFILFSLAGRWIVELLYGNAYSGAYLPLVILCAGQMANSLFGSVGLLLRMTGHERDVVRWLTLSSIANIVLGILLIPQFGIVGAAVASVSSILIWNFAFWQTAIRKIGIDGSVFAKSSQMP